MIDPNEYRFFTLQNPNIHGWSMAKSDRLQVNVVWDRFDASGKLYVLVYGGDVLSRLNPVSATPDFLYMEGYCYFDPLDVDLSGDYRPSSPLPLEAKQLQLLLDTGAAIWMGKEGAPRAKKTVQPGEFKAVEVDE